MIMHKFTCYRLSSLHDESLVFIINTVKSLIVLGDTYESVEVKKTIVDKEIFVQLQMSLTSYKKSR